VTARPSPSAGPIPPIDTASDAATIDVTATSRDCS
jgi:hypothetical protein